MAEYENVDFIVAADQIRFTTQTNGDKVRIDSLNLDADQTAALAYLVNQDSQLQVRVRKVVE